MGRGRGGESGAGALGPDAIFDLAYRNTVLVAAGPLVRTPEPMMWMHLVPLDGNDHRVSIIAGTTPNLIIR